MFRAAATIRTYSNDLISAGVPTLYSTLRSIWKRRGKAVTAMVKYRRAVEPYPAFSAFKEATGAWRAPGPGCTWTCLAASGSPHSEHTMTGSNTLPQFLCS
jgi:hypothetical protein